MLRVNVGLSRKLSKDFNSTGYSINLDGEVTALVSDADAVIGQINELFDLAEEALNQEIERAEGEAATASRDVQRTESATIPARNGNEKRSDESRTENRTQGNGHREDEPATSKQINYLLSIGKRQQLTTAKLEAKVSEILGRPVGLYDLTKKSAGVVIDALTGEAADAKPGSRV